MLLLTLPIDAALLDELDKELNTYAMRVREWYGWHFPEMGKIVTDNIAFAKTVKTMGMRSKASSTDLSSVLDEDTESELKEAAEISMGTEISEEDLLHIVSLCDQVISISEYRTSLFDYLKNRMNAIAPNLAVMVGELVGARLIAHAGSLMNLAKCPASTVQILGAEKALFRALKTKHDTPKYGLIYHASLVGQSAPKNKGKLSRVLAGKTALAARVDALGDGDGVTIGFEAREKVEQRLRMLEGGNVLQLSGRGKSQNQQEKYVKVDAEKYETSDDVTPMKKKEMVLEMSSNETTGMDVEKKSKKKKKSLKKSKRDGDVDGAEKEKENAMVEDEEDEKKEKKKEKKMKKEKQKTTTKKKKKRDRDGEDVVEKKSKKKSKSSKSA